MKPSDPEVLIQELIHNSRASGNKPLERRLTDLTIWFYHNKSRIPPENLLAKAVFLEKAFWIHIELCALLLERLHDVELGQKGKRSLWVPNGINVDGRTFS